MSIVDSRQMTRPLLSSTTTNMNTALAQRQPKCRNPLSGPGPVSWPPALSEAKGLDSPWGVR